MVTPSLMENASSLALQSSKEGVVSLTVGVSPGETRGNLPCRTCACRDSWPQVQPSRGPGQAQIVELLKTDATCLVSSFLPPHFCMTGLSTQKAEIKPAWETFCFP